MKILTNNLSNYKALFALIRKCKLNGWVLTLIFFLTLTGAVANIAFPLFTRQLVDQLGKSVLPWATIFFVGGLLVFESILEGFTTYLLGKVGEDFVEQTRSRVHSHLLRLPVYEFEKGQSAEPAGRLVNDTKVISELMSNYMGTFISGMFTLVASLIILFFIDGFLTIVLFGCVIGAFLIILPIAGVLTKISREKQEQEAGFIASLAEIFGQIRLVKSSNAEKQETQNAQKQVKSLYSLSMKEIRVLSFLSPIMSLAVSFALVAILVVGAGRVAEGIITIGTLIAFILYLFNVILPLVQLSLFVAALNTAAGAAERLEDIEQTSPEPASGDTTTIAGESIQIQGLRFAYPNQNTPSLSIEQLDIPANQVTALVGSSGSGKSTLFGLLQRFYLCSGIRIGGRALEQFSLQSLRDQIALVAQNSPVLAGSILYNLCYGLAEPPSEDECVRALEQAQLWSFLKTKEGLYTRIGEQGLNLSGGQKQRLAIARGILRKPHLLLLDEATSALDAQTEHSVTKALESFMEDRTTIVAAHRLSTVIRADQIVVMDQGRILDIGKHETLLKSSEHYRKLVEKQLLTHSESPA